MRVSTAEFIIGAAGPRQFPKDPRPEIAFLGRSNVGKSSLINGLCGRKTLARPSSTPGKTRELNFYLINDAFHMVDLPGYGFARVPEQVRSSWGTLIEQYLRNRTQLAAAVLVVDARHDPTPLDLTMAGWLEYYHIPFVVALTKCDKVPRSKRAEALTAARHAFEGTAACRGIIPFSAVTGEGKPELARAVGERLQERTTHQRGTA